jgi:hypothetical protein
VNRPRFVESGDRHRDSLRGRLGSVVNRDHEPSRLLELGGAGKERGDVSVLADSQEHRVQRVKPEELLFVAERRVLRTRKGRVGSVDVLFPEGQRP